MKSTMGDAERDAATEAYRQRNAAMAAIIKPLRTASYEVDMEFRYFHEHIEKFAADYGGLELNPDFQRGHVWTPDQQRHFVENVMRGVVSSGGFHIQFNCPNWDNDNYNGDLPRGFQCLDGLQRITAVRQWVEGKIQPCGLSLEDLKGTHFSPLGRNFRFRVAVHTFQKKSELLAHYLALNAGGTPHSPEEIARVRAMQEAAANPGSKKASGPALG